jgi:hypothetical protein
MALMCRGIEGIYSAIKADHAFETTNFNNGAIDLIGG